MSKYKTYSYPRVNTSVTALERVTATSEAADTTVLFVPFVSERGPIEEVKKIHSLEEFQMTYGEISNYVGRLGKHTAFNIMNWLTAGGTVYAYRLSGEAAAKAIFKDTAETVEVGAKEVGEYLNNHKIIIQKSGSSAYYVTLKNSSGVSVERIYVANPTAGKTISLSSEYLSYIKFTTLPSSAVTLAVSTKGSDGITSFSPALYSFWAGITAESFEEGTDATDVDGDMGIDSGDEKASFPTKCAKDVLGNPLEFQIDLIMDAGYPEETKVAMMQFIADYDESGEERSIDDQPVRDDIRGIFEFFESDEENSYSVDETITELESYFQDPNIFIFSQDMTIVDGIFDNTQIKVGPTYFLSSLIPANDINNGIQFPVAGTRRAELEGVVSLSWNPLPDEKEQLFQKKINYIEKDSRGYYFMGNRTLEKTNSSGNNTALTFMNNSRVVCKMVHELELLGREYLFEFNDSITIANMTSRLNTYVSQWIANRTLSYGEVTVAKSSTSDEAVDVTLNIKFVGTIEVISIDIVIE